jgi:site-specific DNA-cytosine methylase
LKFLAEDLGMATDDMHCFSDIADLSSGEAHCTTHQKKCQVPSSRFMHCGFSCKNLSKLFNASQGLSRLGMLSMFAEGTGSTGSTFKALMKYLEVMRPPAWMWENVEEIFGNRSDADQVLYETMSELGYTMATETFDAFEYGVPQGRVRAYGLCIHVTQAGLTRREAQMLVDQMMALAFLLQLIAINAAAFCRESPTDCS